MYRLERPDPIGPQEHKKRAAAKTLERDEHFAGLVPVTLFVIQCVAGIGLVPTNPHNDEMLALARGKKTTTAVRAVSFAVRNVKDRMLVVQFLPDAAPGATMSQHILGALLCVFPIDDAV